MRVPSLFLFTLKTHFLTMTTFTWQIAQLERDTVDGLVYTGHYTVDADEGTYRSATSGSAGL